MSNAFLLEFEAWEDGELVPHELTAPDRWAVHAAERVRVTLPGDLSLWAVQRPRDIPASRVGVGAVLWDGALVLAAHVARLPAKKLRGARCLELGAGVGLVGIAAALRGARVAVTDIRKVLPLLEENLVANGLGGKDGRGKGGKAVWELSEAQAAGPETEGGEGPKDSGRGAAGEDDAGRRDLERASCGAESAAEELEGLCVSTGGAGGDKERGGAGDAEAEGNANAEASAGGSRGADAEPPRAEAAVAAPLSSPPSPRYDAEVVQGVAFPDPFVEGAKGHAEPLGALVGSGGGPGSSSGTRSPAPSPTLGPSPSSAPSSRFSADRSPAPCAPLGSSGVCLELEWGKPGYLSLCSALASPPLAYVFAADVCYVDGDGESPSTEAFARACDALVGEKTVLLVAQERRAEAVRQAWKAQAERRFESVRMLSSASLPEGLRVPHIDVWELKRGKRWKKTTKHATKP